MRAGGGEGGGGGETEFTGGRGRLDKLWGTPVFELHEFLTFLELENG